MLGKKLCVTFCRVGYLERRFINKALKLADFYSIKSVRSNPSVQVRGTSSIQRGLKLLEDLSQDIGLSGKLRPKTGKLRPGKLRPSGKMNEMNAHLQITI